MSGITPFARRSRVLGNGQLKWWPWPIGLGGEDVFYESTRYPLPPREVLDWLSVAEWRFQIEVSSFGGNTARSINEVVKMGTFYTYTYDMGAPETHGRESLSIQDNLNIGYDGQDDYPGRSEAFCGILMSWRETISMVTYDYSANILLKYPGLAETGGDYGWGMLPECELLWTDGSTSLGANYVNVDGLSHGDQSPVASYFTTVSATIETMF